MIVCIMPTCCCDCNRLISRIYTRMFMCVCAACGSNYLRACGVKAHTHTRQHSRIDDETARAIRSIVRRRLSPTSTDQHTHTQTHTYSRINSPACRLATTNQHHILSSSVACSLASTGRPSRFQSLADIAQVWRDRFSPSPPSPQLVSCPHIIINPVPV